MPGVSLAVFDGRGAWLAGRWNGLPAPSPAPADQGRATMTSPSGRVRVYWARQRHAGAEFAVAAAQPLARVDRELGALRRALLGTVLVALLLAGAGGWWISCAGLRPVTEMADQARRITDRTPGFRLAAPNPEDELGLLSRAFNDLLGRLESALSHQRRFMAEASHELRTPVSIARTAIEVTLDGRDRSEEEYRDALAVVAEQIQRLSRIVDDMFTLARADVGGLPMDRSPLYVDELVAECVRETRVLAGPKGVDVGWDGASEVEATGNERLLRQMLINLLDNAIRYTPAGRAVRVNVAAAPDAVELAVSDGGQGIPEAERERIFERFVRLDAARHPWEGAGLGLPIARAIAEAHGGTLVLARSDPSGSTFLARLPLVERRA
jgi:two-component system OmpR family sensor kinase